MRQLCVAFDLDDTLYNEQDFVMSGRAAVAREISAKVGKTSEHLISIMNNAENAFDALLALPEVRESNIGLSEILHIYRTHEPDLTLSEESRAIISWLINQGVGVALITDGRSLTQRNKIRALGLDKLVDEKDIIVSEEIGADKKTARPFELLMEHHGSKNYVYVGDNPAKDFFQARKLGWKTVMLRDAEGINVHSQDSNGLEYEYQPDYIIDNIKDLKNIIMPCLQH